MTAPPSITADSVAGIGTQHLTDDGKQAIRDLFARSFPPQLTPTPLTDHARLAPRTRSGAA